MQIYKTYFVFGIYELLELGAIGGKFHPSIFITYLCNHKQHSIELHVLDTL